MGDGGAMTDGEREKSVQGAQEGGEEKGSKPINACTPHPAPGTSRLPSRVMNLVSATIKLINEIYMLKQ